MMAWLDVLVDEWTRKLAAGEDVPEDLHVYLHMTEQEWKRWQVSRPAYVAGSDEVGYGPLAGPLVVCAVCAPYDWAIPGLRDSKRLKDAQREEVAARLYAQQRAGKIRVQLLQVDAVDIDRVGVHTALRRAHCSVLDAVAGSIRSVLRVADGDMDLPGEEISVPKADTFIPQVMAASILAKCARDNYMKDMAELYPGYGFEHHVGYGTKEHYAAIEKLGPCALHRMSYAPFKVKESVHDGGD
jgi:ribonuclease HII